jgi:Na+-transporting NADH:ubiquinone oxidoreductase subunit NqrD
MSPLPQPDAWYDSQLRARNHFKEFMAAYNFQNDEMLIIIKQICSYLDVTDLLSGNLALHINKTVLDQIIMDICGDE